LAARGCGGPGLVGAWSGPPPAPTTLHRSVSAVQHRCARRSAQLVDKSVDGGVSTCGMARTSVWMPPVGEREVPVDGRKSRRCDSFPARLGVSRPGVSRSLGAHETTRACRAVGVVDHSRQGCWWPPTFGRTPGETVGRFDVAAGATSRLIAHLDRGEPCQWRFRRRRPCRPRFMVGIGDAGGDVCVGPTERPSPPDVGRVAATLAPLARSRGAQSGHMIL
jgi:hypothetical protein